MISSCPWRPPGPIDRPSTHGGSRPQGPGLQGQAGAWRVAGQTDGLKAQPVAVAGEPLQPQPRPAGPHGADGDSGRALIFNFILLPPPPLTPHLHRPQPWHWMCACEPSSVERGWAETGCLPPCQVEPHRPAHQPWHTHHQVPQPNTHTHTHTTGSQPTTSHNPSLRPTHNRITA